MYIIYIIYIYNTHSCVYIRYYNTGNPIEKWYTVTCRIPSSGIFMMAARASVANWVYWTIIILLGGGWRTRRAFKKKPKVFPKHKVSDTPFDL